MTDAEPFVPVDFAVPAGTSTERFVLEPLAPRHNAADHAAWMSSIEHIRATPGFDGRSWPAAMSLADNLADVVRHAADFAARTGFTYTVLDPGDGDVIGCVYLYPPRTPGPDVSVRSWVRADRAALDGELYRVVSAWLAADWPFRNVAYDPR